MLGASRLMAAEPVRRGVRVYMDRPNRTGNTGVIVST